MNTLLEAASGWARIAVVATATLFVIGWWWHNDKRASAALTAAGVAAVVVGVTAYWRFP